MSRVIFHIDVNSAYLSWTAVEQLKGGASLDIRTIPAIIGGEPGVQAWRRSGKIHPCKKVRDRDRGTCGERAAEMPESSYGTTGSQDVSAVQPGIDGFFTDLF